MTRAAAARARRRPGSRSRWPGPGSRSPPRSPRCSPWRCCRGSAGSPRRPRRIVLLAIEQPDAAVVAAAAALPVPLLLYRRGTAWSVPALAPALGLATLAGAYPALAGRARGWFTRAALGALGAWWVLLYDVRDEGEAGLEAVVDLGRAALRGRVGDRRADPALARPRPLARAPTSWPPPYGPPRWAPGPPRRPKRSAYRSRAGSCSLPSSPACSRSRYPTSVALECWSRDAGPDTVHPQPWPPLPGSGA